jgi:enamine deaminase RidA (YjgF/YER057c/UK114 family)
VSAYAYPREYGVRSPSFARATLWNETLFIGGTASIVGHETRHAGNIRAQLAETLVNINAVTRAAGRTLADLRHVKLYLRNASDVAVASELAAVLPHAKLMVVEADICRRELLLEIEAVG